MYVCSVILSADTFQAYCNRGYLNAIAVPATSQHCESYLVLSTRHAVRTCSLCFPVAVLLCCCVCVAVSLAFLCAVGACTVGTLVCLLRQPRGPDALSERTAHRHTERPVADEMGKRDRGRSPSLSSSSEERGHGKSSKSSKQRNQVCVAHKRSRDCCVPHPQQRQHSLSLLLHTHTISTWI